MASSSYIAIASFFFADTFSWVSSAAVLLKDVDDDNNDSWSASSEQRKNVSQTGSSNRATRRIFFKQGLKTKGSKAVDCSSADLTGLFACRRVPAASKFVTFIEQQYNVWCV